MMRHTLDRLTILEYALEGLYNYMGQYSGQFEDEEAEELEANEKELIKRIERLKTKKSETNSLS